MSEPRSPAPEPTTPPTPSAPAAPPASPAVEIGGRTTGLDPTRYGDWEKDGRCIDF
ncbi:MAG: DUF1674 domain-containing protein [Rhodanobacteraceae bacterium]|jgi:hypothetical protein|nr:DUF1674 domain-containing protein [Rhodanobacteraceae bacterium]